MSNPIARAGDWVLPLDWFNFKLRVRQHIFVLPPGWFKLRHDHILAWYWRDNLSLLERHTGNTDQLLRLRWLVIFARIATVQKWGWGGRLSLSTRFSNEYMRLGKILIGQTRLPWALASEAAATASCHGTDSSWGSGIIYLSYHRADSGWESGIIYS